MNARTFLMFVVCVGVAVAQPPAGFGPPPGGPGGGRGFGGMNQHTKILAKYDKDADGTLSAAERKDAQAGQAAARAGSGRRGFGGRGGGNPEPIAAGPMLKPADVKVYGKEGLYDPSVLRTIFLDFEDADWEQQMADFYHTDVDVPAKMTVDGKVYKTVGVHFRGASSFMMVSAGRKRSLGISMSYSDNKQRLLGYKSLDLLNSNGDPTYMRTILYNQIARAYVPAPQANFMRVVINGESWGIYPNAQEYNADLTQDAFKSRKGRRWKVPGNPGAQGGLKYLGEDVAEYKKHYELKTADDPKAWADLIRLCKVLSETSAAKLEQALAGLLDVDETLKFLALDKAMINTDGYWVRMSDYSIYQDEKGKFYMLPHDANETLRETEGGFGGGRGFGGGGGTPVPAHSVELDPLLGSEDERKALLNKLLAVPALRARYLTYMRDIAEKWFDWKKIEPIVMEYQTLIAADVKTDGHKLFPYDKFVNGLAKDDENPGAGPTGGPQLSLRSFFQKRQSYLLNYPEIKALPR